MPDQARLPPCDVESVMLLQLADLRARHEIHAHMLHSSVAVLGGQSLKQHGLKQRQHPSPAPGILHEQAHQDTPHLPPPLGAGLLIWPGTQFVADSSFLQQAEVSMLDAG